MSMVHQFVKTVVLQYISLVIQYLIHQNNLMAHFKLDNRFIWKFYNCSIFRVQSHDIKFTMKTIWRSLLAKKQVHFCCTRKHCGFHLQSYSQVKYTMFLTCWIIQHSQEQVTTIVVCSPSIKFDKFDHGCTTWLSCLFNCCCMAWGCRDRHGRNNLCRKGRICVWSLVCWSCCTPFYAPPPFFFLLLCSSSALPLTWGVGSECFSTSCGWLQDPPRAGCWCQVLSCLSCRHPCSSAVGGHWFSSQMPAFRKECLLGCGHPPCVSSKTASYK